MLDVPLEGITSLSTVQIVGDREVSVTGCRSVLDYTTERILLRVTSGHVMIQGGNGISPERSDHRVRTDSHRPHTDAAGG